MARRKTRTLTELELEIMQVVWGREKTTVEEIRRALEAEGKPLALPSVRTMLGILQEKGYVKRRASGRRHIYRACVSRDRARKSILTDVIDRAFDGSALDMVAALIDSRAIAKGDVEKVKALIERAEARGAAPRKVRRQ